MTIGRVIFALGILIALIAGFGIATGIDPNNLSLQTISDGAGKLREDIRIAVLGEEATKAGSEQKASGPSAFEIGASVLRGDVRSVVIAKACESMNDSKDRKVLFTPACERDESGRWKAAPAPDTDELVAKMREAKNGDDFAKMAIMGDVMKLNRAEYKKLMRAVAVDEAGGDPYDPNHVLATLRRSVAGDRDAKSHLSTLLEVATYRERKLIQKISEDHKAGLRQIARDAAFEKAGGDPYAPERLRPLLKRVLRDSIPHKIEYGALWELATEEEKAEIKLLLREVKAELAQ